MKLPYDMPDYFEEALDAMPESMSAFILVTNDAQRVALGDAYRVDAALLTLVALAATSVGAGQESARQKGLPTAFASFDPVSLRLMYASLRVLNEAFPTEETIK
jgi:hypothetical protein